MVFHKSQIKIFKLKLKSCSLPLNMGDDIYQPTASSILSLVPSWTANVYLQIIWTFCFIFFLLKKDD